MQLLDNKALLIINNAEELSEKFIELLENRDLLKQIGNSAFKVFTQNRGALQEILNQLDKKFKIPEII